MLIKAIRANIYRNPKFGDCSMNGITNRFDNIIIPHDDGYIDIDTENAPENFCELEKTAIVKSSYKRFVPHHLKDSTMRMMGGCFAYSCDARFTDKYGDYPIPIHDRIEKE